MPSKSHSSKKLKFDYYQICEILIKKGIIKSIRILSESIYETLVYFYRIIQIEKNRSI